MMNGSTAATATTLSKGDPGSLRIAANAAPPARRGTTHRNAPTAIDTGSSATRRPYRWPHATASPGRWNWPIRPEMDQPVHNFAGTEPVFMHGLGPVSSTKLPCRGEQWRPHVRRAGSPPPTVGTELASLGGCGRRRECGC
jgi:hypothetical protein